MLKRKTMLNISIFCQQAKFQIIISKCLPEIYVYYFVWKKMDLGSVYLPLPFANFRVVFILSKPYRGAPWDPLLRDAAGRCVPTTKPSRCH